ncbi:MAG: SDR family NAD(P)-dependent oxidoreductase [Bosea sp. (in: a-proteobacteria)]|jgi:NAD(P)-dependent dehydrogenase (short-subunit alcohol dehydrogenase family)
MNQRFSLAGRRALVTGASSGIGRAIALGLAEQGASVVLHHSGDAAGVEATASALGGAPFLEADFTATGAAKALAAEALRAYGPIDILIANAAIELRAPWAEISDEQIMAQFMVNLGALLGLVQAVVPPMMERGWGRIVGIGSVMATRPRSETVVYSALKSAQLTALRAIGRDTAGKGVTANVVSPGAIEIEKNAARYAEPEFRRAVVAKIPARRAGKPEDVVGAVLFLCSDAASYITGANIPVDGGWTIGDAPGALPGDRA